MRKDVNTIHQKIKDFKKKYYLDLAVRGAILSLLILSSYYLLAAVVEHNLWLGRWARFIAFASFLFAAGFCIYRFLKAPLQWWVARKGLSEEESARLIGSLIPEVKDHLVNFIQLEVDKSNSLAAASLTQRANEFEPLSFDSVIDLKQNTRYARLLLIPFILFLLIILLNKSIITDSTKRIINFSREYSPKAPFAFLVDESALTAFYNEDFTLKIGFQGSSLPESAYLLVDGIRLKMDRNGRREFQYTFEKMQKPIRFQVEAAGFFSHDNIISVVRRPELTQLEIGIEYPRYLRRRNESVYNSGNLSVPEGSKIRWEVETGNTGEVHFSFLTDTLGPILAERVDNQIFRYQKTALKSEEYEIGLKNLHSENKDQIRYSIEVIKDQYPSISVNSLQDSVLYKRVLLGGLLADDYGITQLNLSYTIRDENDRVEVSRSQSIPVTAGSPEQNFFYNWPLDSLRLNPGSKLEYFLEVWDNDGVNGRKSTRTAVYSFIIPTESELLTQIKTSQSQTEKQIDQSLTKAEKLQDQIEQASQKLKGKQSMNWEDKKMLEDIIQQKQNIENALMKLQEENKLLEQKKESLTEQDQRIKEKAQQIQKLMDELLDEETKKLFDELQKLMKENAEPDEIQKLLNKLNQNSNNLEKELERILELFKDLQFDSKLDQISKSLDKQIEQQKDLLEKTEQLEKSNSRKGREEAEQKLEELSKQQESLLEDARQNAEELKQAQKLGEELHKDPDLPGEKDSDELIQNEQESKENLDQNDLKKAKESQQKSLQKLKQMQQQMQTTGSSMEMEMEMENMESLRQIVHSLIRLSFDQETLLKQFNELTPSDPRFNPLAQKQLKLKDDSKVLEDSLFALAKRDPFMGSIITKEVGELKSHIDKVIEANKERRRPQAATEMQASMTSINNLALMLDDHYQMLMQMMANAKPSMGKPKKGQKPSLSEMQQKLNQKIQQLKNSGKTGKQLSEELAEMAAEQERIRKAFEEMQESIKGGNKPGDQLPMKMEQTEMELVNKQLTDQLIRRQQEILTRLLEAEKSSREQDQDEERKGESAKDYDKEIPKAFEEYLRLKEKEVELLKTVPPKLYPYYKKEVGEYFKRMGQ
jgi:hypothetical protein